MSTSDISRHATDFRKHYTGVRMQQGRVLTDDDFNEAELLAAEELRRTRLHAIGAYGTPDGGFLPKDFDVTNGQVRFTLGQGHLYLGGLHLALNQDEAFHLQADWLNFDPQNDSAPAPPAGQSRIDLVWIDAWQQPVTAIEDRELFEVALGGPDTTTRWRTMRRVRLARGVAGSECSAAWAEMATGFGGSMSADMQWHTDARLRVAFTAPALASDLCSPPTAGGYLGAENQAVRVQMVDATHYTWGFDNAAPLYRVVLGTRNGQRVKLTLQTPPRDAVHWPLRDTVVELLPWSAVLPNGERVADLQGHLCKVSVSYNPDDQTLELDTPVPDGFGTQWTGRSDQASLWSGQPEDAHFYLRVWARGDDTGSPAAIPITQGSLGNTGLSVQFTGGPLRPADHWIIAARPAAPDQVVPWSLTAAGGERPHGVLRWRAPLGLVRWSSSAGPNGSTVTTGELIHDCRPPFLPLARLRGCCSVTVGDGTESHGQYTSIQAAVNALPPSGGVVCILPGRYRESVRIADRQDIGLHGCGPRSRIEAPSDEGDASSALSVTGSHAVTIDGLALEGGLQPAVHIQGSTSVRLADCLVQMRDARERSSLWPAVFAQGEAIEIRNNIVEALPIDQPRDTRVALLFSGAARQAPLALSARCGIQLGGGSVDMRVEDNLIAGGTGHGITLGHILRFDDRHPDGHEVPDIDKEDPCEPCAPTDVGTPPSRDGEVETVRYESAGDLYDVSLRGNLITRCGANGISVVRFFSPQLEPLSIALVGVHGLRVLDNQITHCLRREVAKASMLERLLLGYGGITLAQCTALEVAGNRIENNGRDWLTPVCGLFVLASDGLRIEHNLIRANGVRSDDALDNAQAGWRAGIHIWLALTLGGDSDNGRGLTALAGRGKAPQAVMAPQIRVHANQVVQPFGRALFMLGAGAMQITNNLLASRGAGRPADVLATTALVANAGLSREWTSGLLKGLAQWWLMRLHGKGDSDEQLAELCRESVLATRTSALRHWLPTGKLMFHDNQVSFDMPDAAPGVDLCSTLLLSLDDLSICSNQFEHHTEQRALMSDLVAAGLTLRCNDNRMAETWGRALLSALTVGLLNTTSSNQSTHCLHAVGMQVVRTPNQALADVFCPEGCGSNRRLSLIARSAQAAYMAKQ